MFTQSLTEIEKMFDEKIGTDIRKILLKNFDNGRYLWSVADKEIKDYYRSQFSALLTELTERTWRLRFDDCGPKDLTKVVNLIQEYLPSEEK